MSMPSLGVLRVRFWGRPSFSHQVNRHTAITGALLLQFYSCTVMRSAGLRLNRYARINFIDSGHIAARELRPSNFAEQMCLTNANYCA